MNALKTSQAALHPTADISINKQRQKKYGRDVFLKDGANFEIELSNNTTSQWLAKFKINGKYISTSGLVLKPGQHHYLERYLDDAKKLQFSTYEVGSSEAVKAAIANNGLVEVEFYEEVTPAVFARPTYTYDYWNSNQFGTSKGILLDNTTYGDSTFTGQDQTLYSSNVGEVSNGNSMGFAPGQRNVMRSASPGKAYSRSLSKAVKCSSKIETGRIEEGANSNQRFGVSTDKFNSWVTHTVTFHLKPDSQKNIRPQDIKVHCTNCGATLKPKWNNCPVCGTHR